MTVFNFDLEDGGPVISIVLTPPNAGRFVTFMAECDVAKKRSAALEASLRDCLEQLEGWVAWKCPKKYRSEHEAFLAKQRALLEGKGSPV